MRRIYIITLLYMSLALPVPAETIDIAINVGNPPFMYQNEETGEADGLYSDLLKEVFNLMNRDVQIVAVPWKRALYLGENEIMGIGGIYKNEKRLLIYDYSDPLFVEKIFVYYRSGDEHRYNSMQSLFGKTVGVISGWSYGDEFDFLRDQGLFMVEENISNNLNFKKLAMGRIDCLLAVEESGRSSMRNMQLNSQISSMEEPLIVNETYLAFNKDSDEKPLLGEFNEALNQLKNLDRYKIIVESAFQSP